MGDGNARDCRRSPCSWTWRGLPSAQPHTAPLAGLVFSIARRSLRPRPVARNHHQEVDLQFTSWDAEDAGSAWRGTTCHGELRWSRSCHDLFRSSRGVKRPSVRRIGGETALLRLASPWFLQHPLPPISVANWRVYHESNCTNGSVHQWQLGNIYIIIS